jgi:DNA-binding LytR/AlgR family response regulator
MKLRTLVIDDEPLARKGMIEYVNEVSFLALAGDCASAAEASRHLVEGNVDLLLLDIQMPRLTGIEFLKTLPHAPMTIFTTAYRDYAIEGYALDVIDYLVKPIPFDRFLKAVQKAYDFHQLKRHDATARSQDYFFVKTNGRYERIFFSDILFIESMQNYVIIHLSSQKHIVYITLAGIQEQLPADRFLKVHKSFIVALTKVSSIDNNELVLNQHRVPVSRTLRDDVVKKIMGDNLLER